MKKAKRRAFASAAVAFGFAAGAIVFAAVDYGTRPRPRANVLLVVVDCLRADHVGCYGYERDTTPNIDALAEEGEVYLNHKAPSSATTASMASFFTSCVQTVQYVPETAHTLAEILKNHGLTTVVFQTNRWLLPKRGFARGIDRYVLLFDEDAPLDSFWWQGDREAHERFLRSCKREGSSIVERAREFVTASGQPFFIYAHMMDAHAPYVPDERFDVFSGTPRNVAEKLAISAGFIQAADSGDIERSAQFKDAALDLYDGAIRQADSYVGELVALLKKSGVYDNTLIIVTADHGDGFLEHGRAAHGNSMFEELVHVPLVVKRPGGAGATVCGRLSSGIDVSPTILAELGFTKRRLLRYGLDGRALTCNDAGEAGVARAFLATGGRDSGFFTYSSVEDEESGFKLIVENSRHAGEGSDSKVMLFNLIKDGGETANLAGLLGDEVERLWPALVKTRRMSYDPREVELLDSMTDEEKAALRALGYL